VDAQGGTPKKKKKEAKSNRGEQNRRQKAKKKKKKKPSAKRSTTTAAAVAGDDQRATEGEGTRPPEKKQYATGTIRVEGTGVGRDQTKALPCCYHTTPTKHTRNLQNETPSGIKCEYMMVRLKARPCAPRQQNYRPQGYTTQEPRQTQ
jgi:hypothetical protein